MRSVPGLFSLTYSFTNGVGKNNGNVTSIVDGMVSGWDFTYGYDYLNRITSATGPSSVLLTFTYDRWGNKSQSATGAGPSKVLTFNTNKNRITTTGYSYDNGGNLTAEPLDAWTGRGAMTYQYDAENRIKSTGGSSTATYLYDGKGKRVKKVTSTETRYYYYDVLGNPVWEYMTYWQTFNLFFNGKMVFTNIASMSPSTVWLHTDHLGTPRLKTNNVGAIFSGTRLYYHPFGERASAKTDPVHFEFTAKERDTDSGLDYFGARYHASTIGRFATVDPARESATIGLPQSWNRYAYTLNNPLKYIDPDGKAAITPWDIADIGFFGYSLVAFVQNPSKETGVDLALDTVGLLPVVPSLGVVKRGFSFAIDVGKAADKFEILRKVDAGVGRSLGDIVEEGLSKSKTLDGKAFDPENFEIGRYDVELATQRDIRGTGRSIEIEVIDKRTRQKSYQHILVNKHGKIVDDVHPQPKPKQLLLEDE